ncbi:hypothetical protein GCM10027184_76830 [Saccharothrix stipae]
MRFDPVGVVLRPGADGLAAVDRVPAGDDVYLAGDAVEEGGEHRCGEAFSEHGEPLRAA